MACGSRLGSCSVRQPRAVGNRRPPILRDSRLKIRTSSCAEGHQPKVPASAIESAVHTILKREAPTPRTEQSELLHRLVTDVDEVAEEKSRPTPA